MKFVSTMTLYGGPSAELCLKKSAEEVASLLGEDGGKGGQRGKISREPPPSAGEGDAHVFHFGLVGTLLLFAFIFITA